MVQTKKFLAMCEMELNDLVEDVQNTIQYAGYKHKNGVISERVYRENLIVYHSQLEAYASFEKILKQAKMRRFEGVNETERFLKERFADTIRHSGYVDRAVSFMERKFKKIREYLQ